VVHTKLLAKITIIPENISTLPFTSSAICPDLHDNAELPFTGLNHISPRALELHKITDFHEIPQIEKAITPIDAKMPAQLIISVILSALSISPLKVFLSIVNHLFNLCIVKSLQLTSNFNDRIVKRIQINNQTKLTSVLTVPSCRAVKLYQITDFH
tara:strand:+ start:683 stop:1150 length:468 start_codon:yes stop_codon:yes gene_type:complete